MARENHRQHDVQHNPRQQNGDDQTEDLSSTISRNNRPFSFARPNGSEPFQVASSFIPVLHS
ncbi:hypothetical protein B2G74_00165 [Burkholderia sp. A27]|nr:hypothetical protein B2G74_00165 [Burkholderia sp. A27]